MPAVPQIPKIIHFTIDSQDFSPDVISARVVPTPGAIQTVRTLDGTTHQDAEPETWGLELEMVLDYDSTRPGLAYYLNANKGTDEAFVLNVHADSAAGSATLPPVSGTVTLVAVPYGGPGNQYATHTVVLPITGDPVYDITP